MASTLFNEIVDYIIDIRAIVNEFYLIDIYVRTRTRCNSIYPSITNKTGTKM